ncbi:hypothetical protein K4K48_008327 [Colletotrichum sp. SAR 10_66]|nr:hypothetical protein K4K48_008327 [Colletotrichum sp. SAR 10_66]
MSLTDLLVEFRDLEASTDVAKSTWYIVAASALAAAGAGSDTIELYRLATEGLTLELEKLVQRRIKEAILKTSCLYGVPKSLQALLPLWDSLPDSHVDHYGPRRNSFEAAANTSKESEEAREARGQKYFDTLWGREAAQFHRDRNFKYQPDLYLLNLKMIYEWHFSEDSILGAVETQMSNSLIHGKQTPHGPWIQLLWSSDSLPPDVNTSADMGLADTGMSNDGTIARIVDFPPHSKGLMHRSMTLDYIFVLKGTVRLVLDDGSRTTVNANESVVQQATMHSWDNETDEWARLLCILVASNKPVVHGKVLEKDVPFNTS